MLRTILLFLFGVAYGSIVTHLHDTQGIAGVKVEGIDRYTWRYLAFWGVAGVLLGRLLPWIDIFWERTLGEGTRATESTAIAEDNGPGRESQDGDERSGKGFENVLGADWTPAVRSIGAFVGIAFAIVRALLIFQAIRRTQIQQFFCSPGFSANFPGSLLSKCP